MGRSSLLLAACVALVVFAHSLRAPHTPPSLRPRILAVSASERADALAKQYARTPVELDIAPLDADNLVEYSGPRSDLALMEAGCVVEDLGIEVLVGESTQPNAGRGLFLSLAEHVAEVCLPRGTPICGYSRGDFAVEGRGDKTVAFAFFSTDVGVIYEKKLHSILRLINYATNATDDLARCIDGHHLYLDAEGAVAIEPTDDYPNRYFLPEATEEWSPSKYGMYANDLGYSEDVDSLEAYVASSLQRNVLQIVWRVELREGRFRPTWPVVILNRDLRLTNKEPMEVGIQYSWRYWLAARELAKEQMQRLPAVEE